MNIYHFPAYQILVVLNLIQFKKILRFLSPTWNRKVKNISLDLIQLIYYITLDNFTHKLNSNQFATF